uniref:Uncharacterized protein n=1 Tax=Romanomermis culicivorax TaxID=13658 RepID=A0A915KQE3_ROMCU
MLTKLINLYPKTKLIVVGFSMGANIVTKYLGENSRLNEKILFGLSVCQGYDGVK